jgi:ParB/RepB/Spo0J family partition protein
MFGKTVRSSEIAGRTRFLPPARKQKAVLNDYPEETETELEIVMRSIDDLSPHTEVQKVNPPLTDAEFERLKKDIEERGIQVPLEITEEGEIVCGNHRWKAAKELGLNTVPCVVRHLREESIVLHAIKDNLNRRQLSKEQREKMIDELLKYSKPQGRPTKTGQLTALTQKDIAEKAGVSERTVRRRKARSKRVSKRQLVHRPHMGAKRIGMSFKYNDSVVDQVTKYITGLVDQYGKRIILVNVSVRIKSKEV